MKKISLLGALATAALTFSCTGTPYGLDPKLAADLYANIAAAGDNGRELTAAMERAPEEQREGMAYLIAYMPEGDRDTLTADFLLGEVEWAYRARETFPWAKTLPDSVFYNDVLPYASMNERREPWRAMFWEKLSPLVAGTTDVRQAIDTINKELQHLVGVEYNTKRRKPHQSPGESMERAFDSADGRFPDDGDSVAHRGDSAVGVERGEPQLDGGVDRRQVVLHGVLSDAGAEPQLVSGTGRQGG